MIWKSTPNEQPVSRQVQSDFFTDTGALIYVLLCAAHTDRVCTLTVCTLRAIHVACYHPAPHPKQAVSSTGRADTFTPSFLPLQFVYLLIYLHYFLFNRSQHAQALPLICFDFLPNFKHLSYTDESRIVSHVPDGVTSPAEFVSVCKPHTANILSTIYN